MVKPFEPHELFREDAPWFDDTPPRWLRAGETVSIYGAGGAGRDLARALSRENVRVRCFLDRSPRAPEIDGIPIVHLDDARPSDEPLLLGLHNPAVDLAALGRDLESRGFSEWHPFAAAHKHLAEFLGERYFLAPPRRLLPWRERFEAAAALFTEPRSREIFWATLAFRMTADVAWAPAPDVEHPYFPKDVPMPDRPLAFVDAGAYVGDTLEYLVAKGSAVERAIAFEPDKRNYATLATRVRDFRGALGPVSLVPCAVSDSTTMLSFSSDGTAASRVDPAATSTVAAVSLDEALADYPVNFVKMDVEGAEAAALHGARRTIERDRPVLAISSYHTPLDHAEIPLLIAELVRSSDGPSGRFFLRTHGHQTFDTVVYFVPDEGSRARASGE